MHATFIFFIEYLRWWTWLANKVSADCNPFGEHPQFNAQVINVLIYLKKKHDYSNVLYIICQCTDCDLLAIKIKFHSYYFVKLWYISYMLMTVRRCFSHTQKKNEPLKKKNTQHRIVLCFCFSDLGAVCCSFAGKI